MTLTKHPNPSIGFALGGLAGNNGFGAGFLQQALDSEIIPQIISCTSGQVYWVAEYLSCLRHNKTLADRKSLKETFVQHLSEQTPYGLFIQEIKHHFKIKELVNLGEMETFLLRASEKFPFSRDIVSIWLATHGKDEKFRLIPIQEWIENITYNILKAGREILSHTLDGTLGSVHLAQKCINTLPIRIAQPLFNDSFFANISQIFNNESNYGKNGIGIVFNSYDPRQGIEYIYANSRAMEILGRKPEQKNSLRENSIFKEIDDEGHSVRSSIWLYQYGFPDGMTLSDGAYYREVLLGEVCADKIRQIYSVRPISSKWENTLPETYIEGEDYKTEIGFNGTFAGEMDKINLIRKVAKDFKEAMMKIPKNSNIPQNIIKYFDNRYPVIEIIQIEPTNNRGYFGYVFEDIDFFEYAYEKAKSKFKKYDRQ